MSGPKANVGLTRASVDGAGSRFPMLIFFPTLQATKLEALGPYSLDVAIDGTLVEGRWRSKPYSVPGSSQRGPLLFLKLNLTYKPAT